VGSDVYRKEGIGVWTRGIGVKGVSGGLELRGLEVEEFWVGYAIFSWTEEHQD
jgi:hypothetical protein